MIRIINGAIGIGGGLLGILSFTVPDINRGLALLLIAAALLVFAPFKTPKEPDDFQGILELLRYSCVVWAVVMGLQQQAQLNLVKVGTKAVFDAVVDLRTERAAGKLPEAAIVEVQRAPPFVIPGSQIVQPLDDKMVVAMPADLVITKAKDTLSRPIESRLTLIGFAIVALAALLRLVSFIVSAFNTSRPLEPKAGPA